MHVVAWPCLQKLLRAPACPDQGAVGVCTHFPYPGGGQEGRGLGDRGALRQSPGLRGTFTGRGHTVADRFDDQRLVLLSHQAHPAWAWSSAGDLPEGLRSEPLPVRSAFCPCGEGVGTVGEHGSQARLRLCLPTQTPGEGETSWEERPGRV